MKLRSYGTVLVAAVLACACLAVVSQAGNDPDRESR
jgi:hypothetical protein